MRGVPQPTRGQGVVWACRATSCRSNGVGRREDGRDPTVSSRWEGRCDLRDADGPGCLDFRELAHDLGPSGDLSGTCGGGRHWSSERPCRDDGIGGGSSGAVSSSSSGHHREKRKILQQIEWPTNTRARADVGGNTCSQEVLFK